MPEGCPDIQVLNRLLAGTLTPEGEERVSEHLDQCPKCRQRLERASAGDRTLRAVARNLSGSGGLNNLSDALKQVIHKCTSDPKILVSPAMPSPDAVYADDGDISIVDSDIRVAPRRQRDDTIHSPTTKPSGGNAFSLTPGSRLGEYEIISEIGRGGMGVVWKAKDLRQKKLVAIKVLDSQVLGDQVSRQRFLREARAVFAVRHPNVVKMFWVEDAPVPHLVMEYVNGPSLRTHLAIKGALDLPTVLRIGHQIASGLAASHKQGITHRDIKPGNIVLDLATGQAKLTDFGLAQIEGDPRLTINGFVAGTPAYMSPEQATGEKVDHRSDLFSLGSVLYTMATGQSPFDDERTVEALDRVCTTEPLAPQSINPGISPALVHLIQRLHAKRRDDRPATAEEVAEILHQQLLELLHPKPSIVRAEQAWRFSDPRYNADTEPLPIRADSLPAESKPKRRSETPSARPPRFYLGALVVVCVALLICLAVIIRGRLL